MPTPSPAADANRLPAVTLDRPSTYVPGENPEFPLLEWNALTNRAKALLQALEARRQANEEDPSCGDCLAGGGGTPPHIPDSEEACRVRFRATQRQLSRLAHRVTGPERHQLQRTVASLHLAYRNLDRSGEGQ